MTSAEQQHIIIVAGGKGVRAGGDCPKQFQLLGGKPMLMHSIQAFYDFNPRINIVVVLPDGFDSHWKKLCEKHRLAVPCTIVAGGETRFHSVKNGLAAVPAEGVVGVHDGARPFVSVALIKCCFEAATVKHCGIVPVIDETNSVRLVTEKGSRAVDRKLLKIVQTPQVFPASALKQAYETDFSPSFTDDASVAEKNGLRVELVYGEESNIKITTPFDLLIAEQYF